MFVWCVGIVAHISMLVLQHLGQQFAQFEPVEVSTQVVAGTNFKIKVHVGDERYVHVKVRFVCTSQDSSHSPKRLTLFVLDQAFRPLPHTRSPPQVTAVEDGNTRDSPL